MVPAIVGEKRSEAGMRTVRLICRQCGHEDKVEILTPDEKRDPTIPRQPVRCPKCGSTDVEVG